MGKGKKTTREMNVLVSKILRKRALKKATQKSFVRPEGAGNAPQETSNVSDSAETSAE